MDAIYTKDVGECSDKTFDPIASVFMEVRRF